MGLKREESFLVWSHKSEGRDWARNCHLSPHKKVPKVRRRREKKKIKIKKNHASRLITQYLLRANSLLGEYNTSTNARNWWVAFPLGGAGDGSRPRILMGPHHAFSLKPFIFVAGAHPRSSANTREGPKRKRINRGVNRARNREVKADARI